MKQFKSTVPESVQNKLKEIAEYINGNMSEMAQSARFGFECESTLHDVEGNYKSGWIPHQDGGFSVDQWVRNDVDSSYHFTEKQTDYNNDQQEQCFNFFLMDSGFDYETSFSDLTDEQKEKLYDYENDWFDPALLQFQMFVEGFNGWKNSHKQVVFRVSINYKDTPYYREKYAEDIKTLTLEIDEFLQMPVTEIIEQLKI